MGAYQGAYDIKIKKECCISMTYHVNTESATQNTVSLYVLFIVKFKNAPENKFQQNFRIKMMDQRINSALYVAKVHALQFLLTKRDNCIILRILWSEPLLVSKIYYLT